MLIYLIAIFSGYFIFLGLLFIGWLRAIRNRNFGTVENFVSVVVAVRNEESTISTLIESLARQSYPKNKFEILVIDDHSTDQTKVELANLIAKFSNLSILVKDSVGVGKKKAITTGVEAAQGEIILTTDADCTLPIDWISGMCKVFNQDTHMVMGAVKISTNNTFFSEIQALEFSSVMGSGIAMLGWNKPVMCNGASLAFRKEAFFEVGGYGGNFQIPSGDDEFLMRKIIKRFPNSIRFVANPDCTVATAPQNSVYDFIEQRLRWGGKWKANDSALAKAVALFVLIVQGSWLVAVGCLILDFTSVEIRFLIALKIGFEFIFLWLVSRYLRQRFYFVAFATLQLLYPIYVISIGVLAQMRSYRWKGRTASFSR